ncbi:MAG: hypothetical protein ACI4MZ_03020 [Christensenellales bacterium]
MKDNGKKEGIFVKLKDDYALRTMIFSSFSALVTIAFVIFNAYLGIAQKSVWNSAMAGYYFLLASLRTAAIACEYVWHKKGVSDEALDKNRDVLSVVSCVFFAIIDVALAAPIILMVFNERQMSYSAITAISIATYTCYKVVIAGVNFKKTAKLDNQTLKIIRILGVKDALLSLLTLQYTLINTFGEASQEMELMTKITGFVVWAIVVATSVYMLATIVAKRKKNQNN